MHSDGAKFELRNSKFESMTKPEWRNANVPQRRPRRRVNSEAELRRRNLATDGARMHTDGGKLEFRNSKIESMTKFELRKANATAEMAATAGKLRRRGAKKKFGHRWGTDAHRW